MLGRAFGPASERPCDPPVGRLTCASQRFPCEVAHGGFELGVFGREMFPGAG